MANPPSRRLPPSAAASNLQKAKSPSPIPPQPVPRSVSRRIAAAPLPAAVPPVEADQEIPQAKIMPKEEERAAKPEAAEADAAKDADDEVSPEATVSPSGRRLAAGTAGSRAALRRSWRQAKRAEKSEKRRSKREPQERETPAEKEQRRKRKIVIAAVAGAALLMVALFALGPMQKARHFSALRSEREGQRAAAVKALIAYKSAVRPRLVQIAAGEEAGWPDAARADAVWALALLQDEKADAVLNNFALAGAPKPDEGQGKRRLWALSAIDRAGTGERFKADVWLANAGAPQVDLRLLAAKGLGRCRGGEAVKALLGLMVDSEPSVVLAASQSLMSAAAPEDAPQIAALLLRDEPHVREAAKTILLQKATPETVQKLGEMLNTVTESAAVEILDLLAQMPEVKGVDAQVLRAVDSRSVVIQSRALEVAGQLRLESTYDKIAEAAKNDTPEVRLSAAKAALNTGSAALLRRMLFLLKDKDEKVRGAAIQAVIQIRDFGSLGELIELLGSDSGRTRSQALEALKVFFPGRAKVCGNNRAKWQTWWRLYQKQLAFVEEMEKTQAEVHKLFVDPTSDNMKKAQPMVANALARIELFWKGKLFKNDAGETEQTVDEFLIEDREECKRLTAVEQYFAQKRYGTMKLQKVDVDGEQKKRAKQKSGDEEEE